MIDHQDLRNDFDGAGKIKLSACQILRVRTKNEENFEIFVTFGPNAQNFADRLLNFTCSMEIIPQLLMILHFLQRRADFLKLFKNFHAIFNSPSLSKLFFELYYKFLNLIIEFTGNFSWFIGYHKN